MSNLEIIKSKIYLLEDLKEQVNAWKKTGDIIVFTNGCFDVLHQGHIEVLGKSADLGSRLIIGLNTDTSVKKLKGKNRPINNHTARSILLASINFVDAIVLFSETTPKKLIAAILPDILTKGGDYNVSEIAGHDIVKKNNGKVITIPLTKGFSSTNIINKI